MESPPPSYDEVMGTSHLRTPPLGIPLSNDVLSLNDSLPELPKFLFFTYDPDIPNVFTIRKTGPSGNVLIEGVNASGNFSVIKLLNGTGQCFAEIRRSRVPLPQDPGQKKIYAQRYTVTNGNVKFGTIAASELDINSLVVINLTDQHYLDVKCTGSTYTDISISRSKEDLTRRFTYCTFRIPENGIFSHATLGNIMPRFSTNLSFSLAVTEFPMTKMDQILCITTLMAFIMTRNNTADQQKILTITNQEENKCNVC